MLGCMRCCSAERSIRSQVAPVGLPRSSTAKCTLAFQLPCLSRTPTSWIRLAASCTAAAGTMCGVGEAEALWLPAAMAAACWHAAGACPAAAPALPVVHLGAPPPASRAGRSCPSGCSCAGGCALVAAVAAAAISPCCRSSWLAPFGCCSRSSCSCGCGCGCCCESCCCEGCPDLLVLWRLRCIRRCRAETAWPLLLGCPDDREPSGRVGGGGAGSVAAGGAASGPAGRASIAGSLDLLVQAPVRLLDGLANSESCKLHVARCLQAIV